MHGHLSVKRSCLSQLCLSLWPQDPFPSVLIVFGMSWVSAGLDAAIVEELGLEALLRSLAPSPSSSSAVVSSDAICDSAAATGEEISSMPELSPSVEGSSKGNLVDSIGGARSKIDDFAASAVATDVDFSGLHGELEMLSTLLTQPVDVIGTVSPPLVDSSSSSVSTSSARPATTLSGSATSLALSVPGTVSATSASGSSSVQGASSCCLVPFGLPAVSPPSSSLSLRTSRGSGEQAWKSGFGARSSAIALAKRADAPVIYNKSRGSLALALNAGLSGNKAASLKRLRDDAFAPSGKGAAPLAVERLVPPARQLVW